MSKMGIPLTSCWFGTGSNEDFGLPLFALVLHYCMREKKILSKVWKIEEAAIPSFSGFVGNAYVQNADAEWKIEHSLQYHTYVIPEGYNLKNALAIFKDACLVTEGAGWWFRSR